MARPFLAHDTANRTNVVPYPVGFELVNYCVWLVHNCWRSKLPGQSSHITFTLRKGHCPAVNINQTIIPQTDAVKYPGLHFDCRLNWKEHIATNRKQIDLKTKEISWLIGEKIPSIYRKQITHLQGGNQTYMLDFLALQPIVVVFSQPGSGL
jgi:hypothetical protein